jgi:glucosamine--fructose-6-phosphate aminotransferase (isomerizing)
VCGIFGIISTSAYGISADGVQRFGKMMIRSERRGKDASGFLILNQNYVYLQKSNKRGKRLLKSSVLLKSLERTNLSSITDKLHVIMGHTRMSTHGDASYLNTQPIVCSDRRFFLFHNGIVVNWRNLAEEFLLDSAKTLSDTVIILKCFEKLRELEPSSNIAFEKISKMITGANNLVLVDTFENQIYFYTSNGSLFLRHTKEEISFGSDRAIVIAGSRQGNEPGIQQIPLNEVVRIQLDFGEKVETLVSLSVQKKFQEDKSLYIEKVEAHEDFEVGSNLEKDLKILEESIDFYKISNIKRCNSCIIPDTYPGISFNEEGICSLCINHHLQLPLGRQELLNRIRESGGKVLVPLSGGRDSAYALHFLEQLPDIRLITYTYDWGFVTNLARENISKICGKLGIEHILEAADLPQKRRNVAKNLRAWLAKPDIGLVPILMAGDKEFLTKAEKVRTENHLGLSIFAMNQFERTGFKSGFAGVSHSYDKKRFHGLSVVGRLRLLAYYGLGVIRNPRYLNSSVLDTLIGFFSFYAVDTNYIQIFDYIDWDESLVEETLISEYEWSKPTSGKSLWRTGDATSAFYNYLYLRYAGFSEFDTFRSNQIRAGVLTRQKALDLCAEENKVRIVELHTYLETVSVSVSEVLKGLDGWGHFSK